MKKDPLSNHHNFSLRDHDMPMPAWNAEKGTTSTPKGRRKSAGTNKAKALLKRLGL